MPDTIVVSNTTPVIALSRIKHIQLLRDLYCDIHIPQAVYDEIFVKNDSITCDVKNASDWIHTTSVKGTEMTPPFSSSLHLGEVEAIMLANEMCADVLIVDDFLARKCALRIGLNVTGTMGILLKSKNTGLIPKVKPLLDEMINEGVFLGSNIYHDVLCLAKEY